MLGSLRLINLSENCDYRECARVLAPLRTAVAIAMIPAFNLRAICWQLGSAMIQLALAVASSVELVYRQTNAWMGEWV